MARWILFLPTLLALGAALGVAAQNIAALLGLVTLSLAFSRETFQKHMQTGDRFFVYASLGGLAYVLISGAMAWVVGRIGPGKALEFVTGHVFWLLVPPLALGIPEHLALTRQRLIKALACLAVIYACLSLSQALWGWRVVGSEIRFDGVYRARGLFSHPLTFAYVQLVFWPLFVIRVLNNMHALDLAAAVGLAVSIYLSESRTIQVIALGVLLICAFLSSRRGVRWGVVAAVGLGLLLLVVIPNPVASKFRQTFAGQHDRQSGYVDDRVAFWHANLKMVQARPLLGHGAHLSTRDREPYYAEIGLSNFEKKYEAHNTFLQAAVEAGMLGFLGIIGWFACFFRGAWVRWRSEDPMGLVLLVTIGAFGLASFTQNSLQDLEVRFAITLLLLVQLSKIPPQCSIIPKT